VIAIATGENHTCALLKDHFVVCWGSNEFGQLGTGNERNSLVPAPVKRLEGVISITTGGSHTCALLADRTVECWGYNFFGQLGDGSVRDSTLPVPVKGF
jgi:alpha-tubulin suppressor-like RCC1 family protein